MIQMATEGPPELDRCDLQIRDRYIAALIVSPLTDGDGVFTMWDWKSGECVLVSPLIYYYYASLYILSPSHKIAASTNPGSAHTPFWMNVRRYWWCQRMTE